MDIPLKFEPAGGWVAVFVIPVFLGCFGLQPKDSQPKWATL